MCSPLGLCVGGLFVVPAIPEPICLCCAVYVECRVRSCDIKIASCRRKISPMLCYSAVDRIPEVHTRADIEETDKY